MSKDGLILLDKPAGITSFSALNKLKSSLETRRIGHAGTLDKFATGLLVVLIGFLLLPVALVLTAALPAALVVMPLAVLVYGLYGAFEVYAGREFRYWLVADWIEQRGVKSPSTELVAQPANQ